MNKKTYITPQTTLVKCHIEGVMQQLSKTGGESKVDPNTPIAPSPGGNGGSDELSKENSGLLWDY